MSTAEPAYHIPVMLGESVDAMRVEGGVYVDVTFGGGGHTREILRRLQPGGRLYSFDQDADALANVPDDPKLTFVYSNFRYLRNWMNYYGVDGIDAILADLGVSSHHFDAAERGFSFRSDAPLDMRMNRRARLTAAEFLKTASEERIADVLYNYGELRNARRIAAAVVRHRAAHSLATTSEFAAFMEPFVGRDKEKKDLARAFQALRIEINDEMGALREMLEASTALLRKGGRLVVLTYHSLEDRMVKNFIKSGNAEGKVEQDFFGNRLVPLRAVNNKVIVPGDDEIERNPRSRSAKLRVAEKL